MVKNWLFNSSQLTSVRAKKSGCPDFFVKFDLEIAIDQHTRACDRTFEGVPDSGCQPVPAEGGEPMA